MAQIRIQEAASWRLDEIYRYTRERWGEPQAERYISGLFDAFKRIESHGVASRPVPAEFGVQGFFFRYERHFVYWRWLSDGNIGIVTILHERMHRIEHLRGDLFGELSPGADPSGNAGG
ncbi:type II toxin-antitoxin system RelE/ParE family toxin [Endothiovibrio diazotrophicus]